MKKKNKKKMFPKFSLENCVKNNNHDCQDGIVKIENVNIKMTLLKTKAVNYMLNHCLRRTM